VRRNTQGAGVALFVCPIHVSFILDQQLANVNVIINRTQMQCSLYAEKTKRVTTFKTKPPPAFTFKRAGVALIVCRIHVSLTLDQELANFEVAIFRRQMQCRLSTEKKTRVTKFITKL
jgi:hypothetical protein